MTTFPLAQLAHPLRRRMLVLAAVVALFLIGPALAHADTGSPASTGTTSSAVATDSTPSVSPDSASWSTVTDPDSGSWSTPEQPDSGSWSTPEQPDSGSWSTPEQPDSGSWS